LSTLSNFITFISRHCDLCSIFSGCNDVLKDVTSPTNFINCLLDEVSNFYRFRRYANHSEDFPDVQFHFAPSSINSDGGEHIRKILGLRDVIYNTMYKPLVGSETWTILPLLLRPKSAGTLRLRSRNPLHHPNIRSNYLSHPEDVYTLIEGIRIAMQISNTTAFRKFGSRPHSISMPGCKKYAFDTDPYWECALRHFTFTIYHPTGTCKMGPAHEGLSVVDHELKVHGIKGLRVIDGSIMPMIVSGNPNAPIIMIGEKGADMIKSTWEHKKDEFLLEPLSENESVK
jgi:choline dehydrogenase-like flavoprotein